MPAQTYGTLYNEDGLNLRLVFLTLAVTGILYRWLNRKIQSRADQAFATEHGCKPMRVVFPYKWPWALDLLYHQYQVNKTQRLLACQTPFFNKLGPNIEMRLFGDVGYLTFDPKNIEAIVSTNFEDYGLGSRSDALRAFLGEGIFTQDGPQWKHSREMLRRPFSKMHYQDLTKFSEPLSDLIENLRRSSGVVDLQPFFHRFTLATTTDLIFGQPIKDYETDTQHAFGEQFDYASMISATRIRLADFYWVYTPAQYRRSCKFVKEYANGFVKQALDSKRDISHNTESKYAFIQDLFDEYQDPIRVRDQLVNVLIAGRDTTACLCSWAIFLLVRHPPALARLQEEIRTVVAEEGTLSRAHIQKLNYLRCILNETNRLYPQLPVNVRIASRNTVIPKGGGPDGESPVMLRKGTGIGWSTYHMHRRKDLYGEDSESFRPERWETGELDEIGTGFMPFHYGPRTCLGKDFALTEASCAIVRLIQTFPRIRLPEGLHTDPTGQERQLLTVLVTSAEGCKVVLD